MQKWAQNLPHTSVLKKLQIWAKFLHHFRLSLAKIVLKIVYISVVKVFQKLPKRAKKNHIKIYWGIYKLGKMLHISLQQVHNKCKKVPKGGPCYIAPMPFMFLKSSFKCPLQKFYHQFAGSYIEGNNKITKYLLLFSI